MLNIFIIKTKKGFVATRLSELLLREINQHQLDENSTVMWCNISKIFKLDF